MKNIQLNGIAIMIHKYNGYSEISNSNNNINNDNDSNINDVIN